MLNYRIKLVNERNSRYLIELVMNINRDVFLIQITFVIKKKKEKVMILYILVL